MLELYHWEPNTCFLAPLIALHEKQLPFTSRPFDACLPGAADEPAFPASLELRLHLEREGPVLVHDGEVICGAFLILEYSAEGLPGPPCMAAAPSSSTASAPGGSGWPASPPMWACWAAGATWRRSLPVRTARR